MSYKVCMIKNILKNIIVIGGVSILFTSCQKDYNKEDETTNGFFGTRSEVYVRAILLQQFPPLDPFSQTWDSISPFDSLILAPDIFYTIVDDAADTLVYPDFFQPSQFENVIVDSLPLVYYITSQFKIPVFGRNMLFRMYDFEKVDSSSAIISTLMFSTNFSITPGDTLQTTNPYPDSLVLQDGDYRVLLYLNWKE